MPSCVFIKICWSLSKAYCIPGKLCHFQSSGIFKLQKNGWHYEKTNVIFGLSAPKNIKKHQKIKIKKTRPKICCPGNAGVSVSFSNGTTPDGWKMIYWRYQHKPILRQQRRSQQNQEIKRTELATVQFCSELDKYGLKCMSADPDRTHQW